MGADRDLRVVRAKRSYPITRNEGDQRYGSGSGGGVDWSLITGKPSTFAPNAHTHPESEVVGLVADLALKAPLASPVFTGVPAGPTAGGGTNTTQLATTAFVQAAVAALINAAPGALDTLDELAAALGDDANFAATMTTALAGKAATGHSHAPGDVTGLDEHIRDTVAAFVVAGTNMTVTHNDGADTLTIASSGGGGGGSPLMGWFI